MSLEKGGLDEVQRSITGPHMRGDMDYSFTF